MEMEIKTVECGLYGDDGCFPDCPDGAGVYDD